MINISEQINTWPYACLFPGEKNALRILVLKENDAAFDPSVFGDADIFFSETPENVSGDEFDVVISLMLPEKMEKPEAFIRACGKLLAENGKLILAMNNRLGIRYFCGDKDPYTGGVFDGIDNYSRRQDQSGGRCYSKSEMKSIIERAGFRSQSFYAVYSGIDYPTHIIAEDYLPNEDLANRILPVYNYPPTVFLKEETLYNSLIRENLIHALANGYLVEITEENIGHSDISYATLSLGRAKKNAYITAVHRDGKVTKTALYDEGIQGLANTLHNHELLNARGINTVKITSQNEHEISMPYIEYPVAQAYLQDLVLRDKERFLIELDEFMSEIDKSGDVIRIDEELGPVMAKAFPDMVPLNAFKTDDGFLFFDQEFSIEEYPVNAVKTRVLATFLAYHGNLNSIKDELYERYGLSKNKQVFLEMEKEFLYDLWSEDDIRGFKNHIRRDTSLTNLNRTYINHPGGYYETRYNDIFRGADRKECIVFGSGNYARKFIRTYGNVIHISNIVDNNPQKWGQDLDGIGIVSPEVLKEKDNKNIKVFVCVADHAAVVRQLDDMRILDYSIYDWNKTYPIPNFQPDVSSPHYHIGYCAGAFDMFHIGHLNLLRRAKERCDYLIVGVMSDERMYNLKKKYPVIPCNERMQVVAGCRYADQVEELPVDRAGIMDAWNMFHFDCMFSGDDHADNPGWLAERERLRERGSDIVFVSYTKEQSSSAIREKMKE